MFGKEGGIFEEIPNEYRLFMKCVFKKLISNSFFIISIDNVVWFF